MKRRNFLATIAAAGIGCSTAARRMVGAPAEAPFRRVRPGEPGWPSPASWERLRGEVGGRLIQVRSPLDACRSDPAGGACSEVFRALRNPYAIGDDPALTQTSGWVDAWTASPSAYAVLAASSGDVVAAVRFARENRLRLVVKGGGHSYQGTSSAPDSLLVWTRGMRDVTLHDAFVGEGCAGKQAPEKAVTTGAGAIWMDLYDAVTTRGGRYVQGGGCTTVGVAGLVQSGGFGSFSKAYGLAAAGLLEAEVVTADGEVRIANACLHPDLFWGLKGGGGGSLGIITRLTLRTREIPETFGAVSGSVRARSDEVFRELIARTMAFYREQLFNPHWGEQMAFEPGNVLDIGMVFQGLGKAQAEGIWRPFLEWMSGAREKIEVKEAVRIVDVPARRLWDAELLATFPGAAVPDDRPGASPKSFFWSGDRGQVGHVLHGYRSAWLPASLLDGDRQRDLAEALFAGSRHYRVNLHFNKGLAGAPREAIDAARDTAMNPGVLDAFALAIIAGSEPPAFPGIPGHEPDPARARTRRQAIDRAMEELLKAAPGAGSYVSESNFFEPEWQRSFWGPNYPRLSALKKKYDPEGLFFVHHGVGSEAWSADGFTKSGNEEEG